MRLAIMAVCAALAACGGALTDLGGGSCTVTLSGAQTGTYPCTVPTTAAYSTSNSRSAIGLSGTGSGTQPSIAISWPGNVHTGTFKQSDTGAQAGITVSSGSSYWAATAGGSTTGSYTLNLTSATSLGAVSQGEAWSVHGTLDATAPAVSGSGATGTVTIHVAF